MAHPNSIDGPHAGSTHGRLSRLIVLSRLALLWERLWPALWPAVGVTGVFVALALFDVLPILSPWMHAVVVVVFAGTAGGLVIRGLRAMAWPTRGEARRRIERLSGLPGRPLQALEDRLSSRGDDGLERVLWQYHHRAMVRLSAAAASSLPRPNLAARDPRALRALVLLLVVVAGVGSWGDWQRRLAAAVTPALAATAGNRIVALDLWVSPPEYTRQPPIYLATAGEADAPESGERLPVPVGSKLVGRLAASKIGTATLVANGERIQFDAVDRDHLQIEQTLLSGGHVAVELDGRRLGRWDIDLLQDRPPAVTFLDAPGASVRGALVLRYRVEDDYGVIDTGAEITRATAAPEGSPPVPPAVLSLPVVRVDEAMTGENSSFHDLTAHPWAGQPVRIVLYATDAAAQRTVTDPVVTTLPERQFTHPVAREIIAQRRSILTSGSAVRESVADGLLVIAARPHRFSHDLTTFLALRVAAGRLVLDAAPEALQSVQLLLWDAALRLEDGGVALAEQALREAQKALSEALAQEAKPSELEALTEELRVALDRYLEALQRSVEEALARGETAPEIPASMLERMVDRSDLQAMVDQLKDLTQVGARDAAQQMLSQLQALLEGLQMSMTGQAAPEGMQEAWRLLEELQALTQAQQELLDRSFRQSQALDRMESTPPQPFSFRPFSRQGQAPTEDPQVLSEVLAGAETQEALRRELGELMRRLGELSGDIPRPLGEAEQAMRDAERALQSLQPGDATSPQGRAIDQLQQGLDGFAEQLARQSTGFGRPTIGQGQAGHDGFGRDPLGRPLPRHGGFDTGDVDIPNPLEVRRAREILEELRRRSGERDRPKLERDYIDRLLQQF